ncbi:MAG: MurT ligase domain-containing protein [Actinobacteria bacterium]|nr:MurT ligase domain-containing protein [Actinomycetota bacterium]MCL5446799.1 MurT ligase domain-containing protein [Actinomycetota bacterium]
MTISQTPRAKQRPGTWPASRLSVGLVNRRTLSTGLARMVARASRTLHLGSGSVIGGRIALLIHPELLVQLASGKQVALVSGTNGKTTTTRMIACALQMGEMQCDDGAGSGASTAIAQHEVATSVSGSNLPAGITAALIDSPHATSAVLEVDEGYLPEVMRQTCPRVIALLNLSRDQLDRVNEVRMTAQKWKAALARTRDAGHEPVVIANCDDPMVTWAACDTSASKIVWVAAGQRWLSDAASCPECASRIVFSSNDAWACSCGFRRPEPSVSLYDNYMVTRDGRQVALRTSLPGDFNRSNAAVAATAASFMGIDEDRAMESISRLQSVEGRFSVTNLRIVSNPSREANVKMMLAKNPAGWREMLDLVDGGSGPVVIGINAKTADGLDPSWLWDVPFELLSGRYVVATGQRCLDMAVRLSYAGVRHDCEPDQLKALALSASAASSIDYIGNYTAFQGLRKTLAADPALILENTRTSRHGNVTASKASGTYPQSQLRIALLYPDILGTYGDGGNAIVLAERAACQGVTAEIVYVTSGTPVPAQCDIYCIGGGEDAPQAYAAQLLRAPQASKALQRALSGGAAVLAVCAGYQILGEAFPGPGGTPLAGADLIPAITVATSSKRAVGEILATLNTAAFPDHRFHGDGSPPSTRMRNYTSSRHISHSSVLKPIPSVNTPPRSMHHGYSAHMPTAIRLAALGATRWPALSHIDHILTGFENHSGRTIIGSEAQPLGLVHAGIGNGFPANRGHLTSHGILSSNAATTDPGYGLGTQNRCSTDAVHIMKVARYHHEGIVYGKIIGTYLHGPVLARNPELANIILELATRRSIAPSLDMQAASTYTSMQPVRDAATGRGIPAGVRAGADSMSSMPSGSRSAASVGARSTLQLEQESAALRHERIKACLGLASLLRAIRIW